MTRIVIGITLVLFSITGFFVEPTGANSKSDLRIGAVFMMILGVGLTFWGRRSRSRLFGGGSEDPTIYTDELRGLRDQLRQNGGSLQCVNCGRAVRIDLRAIEKQIRGNRDIAGGGIFGSGTLLVFSPDWDQGSVCKKCNGVLCGPCSNKALEDSGGAALNMPCCPKCSEVVGGMDHITD